MTNKTNEDRHAEAAHKMDVNAKPASAQTSPSKPANVANLNDPNLKDGTSKLPRQSNYSNPKRGTNEKGLDLPQDVQNITPRMRREISRSIGRMGGKKENLDLVVDTMRQFIKFAELQYDKQADKIARLVAAQNEAEEKRREAHFKTQLGRLQNTQKEIADKQAEAARLSAALGLDTDTKDDEPAKVEKELSPQQRAAITRKENAAKAAAGK
ncbi:hypothetical protein [uncultured Paraglaciecola sp.]|uniref:hypothetical protein n=1 Tax=uncultured Paraglaciecola sp. TaxID=1765024 RepID=UPI0026388AA2|nr:hypothetical protein [uncultured Paraglaciecola sp.]